MARKLLRYEVHTVVAFTGERTLQATADSIYIAIAVAGALTSAVADNNKAARFPVAIEVEITDRVTGAKL